MVSSSDRKPFTFVGIDYFGPILIKEMSHVVKIWVCLFTCLKVRAIHLEIVDDMSTQGFLLCMRRFIGRRGKPNMIVSDNASQFTLGNAVMDKVWLDVLKDDNLHSYIATEKIIWKWITEYAPWKGGFYERLVGSVKRSLKKSLGKCVVTRDQMLTLVVEIEAIVNSRPLLYN